MPYLSLSRGDHYYEWVTQAGQAAPSGKPVMVFLHGWGGSCRYWDSTAQALVDTFDCLLYDMRGFGRSPLPSGVAPTQLTKAELEARYPLESYAEDLLELLQALDLPSVYVNAHSMGASVAVYFANRYPERLVQLILTCSGIFDYDARSFNAFHQFGGYVVKFRPRWLYGLPGMDRLFMQRFLHRSLPGTISRAFLDDFLMASREAALGTIYTSVSQYAAETMPQAFAKLTVPTLLVAGQHDIIIPSAMGQKAANLSPQVTFVEIPDTAHFPMLEDAPTYLQAVRQFLGQERPTATESV